MKLKFGMVWSVDFLSVLTQFVEVLVCASETRYGTTIRGLMFSVGNVVRHQEGSKVVNLFAQLVFETFV